MGWYYNGFSRYEFSFSVRLAEKVLIKDIKLWNLTSITRGKVIFARCWARLNQFQTQSWVKYLGIIILFGWYVCKKNKTKLNINFSLLATCMVFVELCSNFTPQALGRVKKYRKIFIGSDTEELESHKFIIGPQLRFRIFKRIGNHAVYKCIRFF